MMENINFLRELKHCNFYHMPEGYCKPHWGNSYNLFSASSLKKTATRVGDITEGIIGIREQNSRSGGIYPLVKDETFFADPFNYKY